MSQSTATEKGLSNGKSESAIKDRAADAIEKGVEVAQQKASEASERAVAATDHANAEIRKLAETGTGFVRSNPGTAMAGALGVGILVGLALRGRD